MEKTTAPSDLEFTVRSTILDRPRLLVIDPGYLTFDDQNLATAAPTRFLKEEINAVRYGVKSIDGYRFRIGRIYCIDIRDVSGRIIKIRLKSIYRVRIKSLEAKYNAIVKALFQHYFHAIIRDYLQQFNEGQSIELPDVELNQEGVLFDSKVGWIKWDFLGTKRYWHYYTLYSLEKPDQYKSFVFLEDWNAGILYGLIESILRQKFPKRQMKKIPD